VVQLSVKQLLDLFHIRESLEGMACRLAAERMDKAQIEQLRSLLVKHGETSALQAGEAYIQEERDRDFHFCVVQGSGNSMLIKMLCDELYYLLRMYRYQFGMATARAQIAFSEHEHIVQAIANGDGELAEMLMRRHISASRKNVETHLANQLKQEAT
jgi:DNA-binding GntR family transcriptional regulator